MPLTEEQLTAIEALERAATPGPWGYNSYSAIYSGPLLQTETDETPDYPETRRPGPPFFTEADNAWLAQRDAAYEADARVAWVPAHHGDTAIGRHAADADLIAESRNLLPDLIAALRASQAEARRLRAALAWYGEPRNYRVSSAASVNKIAWWPVVRDAGARARATLADDALACMSVVE